MSEFPLSDLSFLAPARLALLALPLGLLVGYLVLHTRRRRYALRFTTLDLLDEVAPDRPGWRRHLPAAGVLVAIVVATLAFARPVVASQTTEARQLVVLAIDTSISMEATDVAPSRAEAAWEAAATFLDTVPEGVAVGVIGFDQTARQLIAPTTRLDAVRRTIERSTTLGEGTAIGEAVFLALDAIDDAANRVVDDDDVSDEAAVGTIVLLSDGETTSGRSNDEAASEARARNVAVHSIAFGTDAGTIADPIGGAPVPVPVNEAALEQLAHQTDGRFLSAATADELARVYEDLGRSVEVRVVNEEVTDWFVGAALLLISFAAMASLRWFGRLP